MIDPLKLTIELVPESSWYNNVRSHVSKEVWDKLRNEVYFQASYKCEICGSKGHKWPVECHEVWEYDDINHVQKLVRLIALCPNCHKVKHVGLARLQGDNEIVIEQLMKVNEMFRDEAEEYIYQAFKIWQEKSKHNWTVDISYLKEI
ncbi:MAG: HNH endonuclease [Candidatus Paceibacterota bacterium]|jgi:hypothetical protein